MTKSVNIRLFTCEALPEEILSETRRYTLKSLVYRKLVWADPSDVGHEVFILPSLSSSTHSKDKLSDITLNHFSGPRH